MKMTILTAALMAIAAPALAADVAATNDRLIGFVQTVLGTGAAQTLRDAADSATLSPLAMFMDADWVVKSVMIGLALASILAWAIWAGKLVQVARAGRDIAADYAALHQSGTLAAKLAPKLGRSPLAAMRDAALAERALSNGLPAHGIKERVSNELIRIEAGAARAVGNGAAIIGSIGSTAPFVGLFGTVWGIMNSFIAIAASGTTNLSVVAPGIAEALLATAIGLVAAIPAVLFYNHLVRVISGYRAKLADAAALVARCLSRDLDSMAALPPAAHLDDHLDMGHLRIVAE